MARITYEIYDELDEQLRTAVKKWNALKEIWDNSPSYLYVLYGASASVVPLEYRIGYNEGKNNKELSYNDSNCYYGKTVGSNLALDNDYIINIRLTDNINWIANHSYKVGDRCVYQGSNYVCKFEHTSTSTFNANNWNQNDNIFSYTRTLNAENNFRDLLKSLNNNVKNQFETVTPAGESTVTTNLTADVPELLGTSGNFVTDTGEQINLDNYNYGNVSYSIKYNGNVLNNGIPLTMGAIIAYDGNRGNKLLDVIKQPNPAWAWQSTEETSLDLVTETSIIETVDNVDANTTKALLPTESYTSSLVIINGYLYLSNNGLSQLSTDNTWTCLSGFNSSHVDAYGISAGKLYKLSWRNYTPTIETFNPIQIGTSDTWSMISGWFDVGSMYGINEGKLYSIVNTTVTQVGTDNNWSYICGVNGNYTAFGLNQGKVYYLSGTSATEVDGDNTWTAISGQREPYTKGLGIKAGNLYKLDYSITRLGNETNWTKISGGAYAGLGIRDGYLYVIDNISSYVHQVGTDNNWSEICACSGKYAINQGKLYQINGTSYTATQVGTLSSYFKLYGVNNVIALRQTSSSDYYTLPNPIVDDKLYETLDKQILATISTVNPSSIIADNITYNRDSTNDSEFTVDNVYIKNVITEAQVTELKEIIQKINNVLVLKDNWFQNGICARSCQVACQTGCQASCQLCNTYQCHDQSCGFL